MRALAGRLWSTKNYGSSLGIIEAGVRPRHDPVLGIANVSTTQRHHIQIRQCYGRSHSAVQSLLCLRLELNMDKWLPVTNVIRQGLCQVRKLTLYKG
jgi:hypothetical protein